MTETSSLPPAPRKGLRYWATLLIVGLLWFTLFGLALGQLWANGLDLGWLLVVGLLFYVGTAVLEGVRSTRAPRFPLFMTDPDDIGFQYEEFTFPSRDGLNLSAWYVPSQNGAHVVLTHGFGENRLGMVPIARILVEAGYGVLLYDSRAHGRSQGNLSSWGWLETADLQGALDYLALRDDVDMGRVGGMGFSVGGQITLRTAALDDRLAAVATDGPSTAVLADHRFGRRFLFRTTRLYPWLWLVYNTQSLLVGRAQPAGVVAALPQISPRPILLISTGKSGERHNAQHFMQMAKEPKSLWEIPDARHGRGLSTYPDEYKQHLLHFFGSALRVDSS